MATGPIHYDIQADADKAFAAVAQVVARFDRMGAQIEALHTCVEDWRAALAADPEPAMGAESNCTCGAPDSAHCPDCLACPGERHDGRCER